MYRELVDLVHGLGLKISFFIDDIAISGNDPVRVLEPVIRAIGRHGHAIHRGKIHIMHDSHAQKITGVLVNKKVSVGQARLTAISRSIFALADSLSPSDRDIKSVLGKIGFVDWVCESQGAKLRRLADRLLPSSAVTATPNRKLITRPCNSFARHRRP
jgi:hypothetical protein